MMAAGGLGGEQPGEAAAGRSVGGPASQDWVRRAALSAPPAAATAAAPRGQAQ